MSFPFFLRNPNESLFAAESFEDLTNDAIAKIDGQCSSRTLSVCSTGMTLAFLNTIWIL